MMDGFSPADLAAVTNGREENGFGGGGAWVLIILFALIFGWGGNGFGGGGSRAATAEDVQNASNFAALERQNNENVQAVMNAQNALTGSIKDASYSNLSEIRGLQATTAAGFADMQRCCCETQRGIDGINYNAAINTASINANTTAQMQKILDALTTNRMADMQNQINALQLREAVCGVVRYPMSMAYNAGGSPFCGSTCGCGCSNI